MTLSSRSSCSEASLAAPLFFPLFNLQGNPGVKSILDTPPTSQWAASGELAPLTEVSVPTDTPASGEFIRQLDAARSSIKCIAAEREDTAEVLDICEAAVDALQETYTRSIVPGTMADGVWLWPLLLPESFISLIMEGHPSALVVLAHFAALMRCFEVYWWSKGWSESVVNMVVARLEARAFTCVEWPVTCVKEEIDVRILA